MLIDPKTYDLSAAVMYRKSGSVFARPATPGEVVVTMITAEDGATKETQNTAAEGDFVTRNPGGEEYIPTDFHSRYFLSDDQSGEIPEGYARYSPIGKALALQVPHAFTIIAPWGEEQHIGANGWLAINPNDSTDVYGIDAKAFADTYELDQ